MSINRKVKETNYEDVLDNVLSKKLPNRTSPAGCRVSGLTAYGPVFSKGTWTENHKSALNWCKENNAKNKSWVFKVSQNHRCEEAGVIGSFCGRP